MAEKLFDEVERAVTVRGYVWIDDGAVGGTAHLVAAGVRNFETVPGVCGLRVYALDQLDSVPVDRACQSCLNDVAARQLDAHNSTRR